MAHTSRCTAVASWIDPISDDGWTMAPGEAMGSDHSAPAMHLPLQSGLGLDDPGWEDRRRSIPTDAGCTIVLLRVSECDCRSCGRRKPAPDGTCSAAATRLLRVPVVVRSEVHEKDALLVARSPSDHARDHQPGCKVVRPMFPGEIQIEDIPRVSESDRPTMVGVDLAASLA